MSIEVVACGGLVTIQDEGRTGWAHLGVPRAGALDRGAARLANRMVGNDPRAAVVEATLGGLTFRTRRTVTIAVTGAPCEVRVGDRPAAYGATLVVPAGEVVRVGPALSGLRSYVAVRGGVDVAPVLGSRSTDTLSWVGPPPLAPGHELPIGRMGRSWAPVDWTPSSRPATPAPGDDATVLRVVAGPRSGWLAGGTVDDLDQTSYVVSPDSDRVGLRLSGTEVRRRRDDEVASEGMVLGAVQLPPSGQPVVFLADHPTTGGYPVVAVVVEEDLDACAQLRPGDRVRMRAVAGRRG